MASGSRATAAEIDRLATTLAKDPTSKAFIPLAEEYAKAGMWSEAAGVLEDGLKYYPGFITAMVALGRAYDQLSQPTKAKAILEEAIKISPENLRAHRTLAKIYAAEGASVEALRSCDVILALNPLDQESLSLRAALGAAIPNTSDAPPTPPIKSLPAAPQAAVETSVPLPSTIAAFAPLAHETAGTDSAVESALPDIVGDATAAMALALETDQPQTQESPVQELSPSDAIVMQELASEQMSSPAPSRNQATIHRLEQVLQSIHTRRRDRPSPEATATSSRS
ncbi:MAG: Tetratricopeptide repeat protein [Nitrospira sp.]|nr:MAG: Tetratricopeptide repeat protein [Nitrospira sp.]